MSGTRVLVAGMGNELLGDDGVGVAVVRYAESLGEMAGVQFTEAGIAGIGLVQDLLDGFAGLVIVDAVQRGARPGTVHRLELQTPARGADAESDWAALLADVHYTVPSRVVLLAEALGALPEHCYLVGCEVASVRLGVGLSAAVASCVPDAARTARDLASHLLADARTVSGRSARSVPAIGPGRAGATPRSVGDEMPEARA